jgi:hypothetical protein
MTQNELEETSQEIKEKILFEQSKAYLKPGDVYRFVTYLFAERKLFVILLMHFMTTFITWIHYGRIKWIAQENVFAEDDPFYWLKRLGPPITFGSKHAILLQMRR